jgi:pimeloyl-ACP methyl ester carboxylesterase
LRLASFPVLGPTLAPFAIRYAVPLALRFWARDYGNIEADERGLLVASCRQPGTDRAFQRSLMAVIDPFGQSIGWAGRGLAIDLPPVALFWGREDRVIPFRHAEDAVRRSRGVTLVSFERCGHYPHLDHVEAFSSLLGQFLSDPDLQPTTLVAP